MDEPLIRFDTVSHSYTTGAHSVPAVRDVSLDIGPAEYVAVLGANGSGKSTLVRLINGLLLPSSGEITVNGIGTHDEAGIGTIRESVSVVFQNPDDQIVATSVEDDVAFGPENLGLARDVIRERVAWALESVGLCGLERREPHLLSGGQKQRLAIAGALAMQPHWLVLDEPTSMLDPVGRVEVLDVLEAVADSGRSVIHVTHDLSEAMRASRALVMHEGCIVFDGSPGDLLCATDRLESWSLELSPLLTLAEELRDHGIVVPRAASTPAAIVEALCR
ncbi:MAG: energy-coupling factor transporter ATPase [Actinobacteria bacterium HGW-Actinobacteria-7]|nr:MAG: energy-coupling factor transporter ATPase [Actinobacteria bacterium HGW-Actinobacteria-7]